MNVSSIVVKTVPGHMNSVINSINSIDFCEVHFSEEDRIVVTIEGISIHDHMESMKCIEKVPFVSSVNLAYSYCEDELTDALEQIKK